MSISVSLRDVCLKYGDAEALSSITCTLEPGKIYGLLGRNGAGKTSLLSLLAAFRKPTSGDVLIDGQPVWENPEAVSRIALIREGGDFDDTDTVKSTIDIGELRPSFDLDYALKLAEKFGLPLESKVRSLSRGKRSALAAVCGLSARADLTMFDEVHIGMDVPSRDTFYKELLAEYMQRPHTVIVSTHLIDEIAKYLEEVVILDRGQILRHDTMETLQQMGATLTGSAELVAEFSAGHDVLSERSLGNTASVTIATPLDTQARARATAAGVEVTAVGLQDLFIYMTDPDRMGV
jgi:ABC-2 type transport system ATP-binding protein